MQKFLLTGKDSYALHYIENHLQEIPYCMPPVHIKVFTQTYTLQSVCQTREELHSRQRLSKSCQKNLHRIQKQGIQPYPLKKAYNKANKQDINSFIFKQIQKLKSTSKSNYSRQYTKIRNALCKFWPLLTADPTISKLIKSYPEITYKQVPSLRDHLVKSHFQTTVQINSSQTAHMHMEDAMSVDMC